MTESDKNSRPNGSVLVVDDTLANLGVLYLSQAQYVEAEPYYEHALMMEAELQWSDAPLVSVGVDHLARNAAAQGRDEEDAAALMGADAATMSPLPELAAAAEMRLEAVCLSFITNFAPNVLMGATGHGEVLEVGKGGAETLSRMLPQLAKI